MKKLIVPSLIIFAFIAILVLSLAHVKAQTSDPGGAAGASGTILGGGCKPTAAAPSYSEAVINYLSCNLGALLRVSVDLFNVMIEGENQTSHLMETSGGIVRVTNLMTNVSINTTSATVTLPTGSKTIQGTLVCNAGASTNCGVTVTIYGYRLNSTTIGEPVCTVILPTGAATTIFTCPEFTKNFLYYWGASTGIAGTSPALTADAMY